MKSRIIHTKFYQSDRVLQLSANSRWLYMYYLTNEGIGLTGAYKWPDARTLLETGLTKTQLSSGKAELEAIELVHFPVGWVVIPDTSEKTGYKNGSSITSKAYDKEFASLPEEVRELLDTPAKGYARGECERGEREDRPIQLTIFFG